MATEAPPVDPKTAAPPGSSSGGNPPTSPSSNGSGGSGGGVPSSDWFKDWIAPTGELNAKALDRLPEQYVPVRDNLSRYRTVNDLISGVQGLQLVAGRKALAPLPQDADDKAKAERKSILDAANGVPHEPKDYGISRPKELPEGRWNQELADGVSAWAHKNSVAPSAVKELVNLNQAAADKVISGFEAREQAWYAAQQKDLDRRLQDANLTLDQGNKLASIGATKLGIDLSKPEGKILLKNASLYMAFVKHAIVSGEDKLVTGDSPNSAPTTAEAQLRDITHNRANPDYKAYYDKTDSRHKQVFEKVKQLTALVAADRVKRRPSP